jgi:hypothetical protein
MIVRIFELFGIPSVRVSVDFPELQELRGIPGLIRQGLRVIACQHLFALICGFGAIANVGIANLLFTQRHAYWWVAGIAGAAMSAVWNYAVSSTYTWHA